MGKKLVDICGAALKEGGVAAQTRLIIKSGMSVKMAESAPDSPENVKKFADIYKEVTGKNCPIV